MVNSYLFLAEIEHVRKILGLPNLEIVLRPEWGSRTLNHRQEIQRALREKSGKISRPHDFSVSHCPGLGGFAFSVYNNAPVIQLGFDVEEDLRVSPEVAQRICNSSAEFSIAPSPASLWTAKEAAFKTLKGPQQPKVVSEIELTDWQTPSSQIETVSIKNCKMFYFDKVLGALIKKNPYTFAIFVSFS